MTDHARDDRRATSPAAVPDVTALAQKVEDALDEWGDESYWKRDDARKALAALLALVEQRPTQEAYDFMVALAEKNARYADDLLAELEQSRQACNICEEPWPHHAEACSYPANVRRMQTAERERDEAQEWRAMHDDALEPGSMANEILMLRGERDEAQAHARELREAADTLAANALLKQDAFDENVDVTIPIQAWRDFFALVVAGRPPECGSIVDHIPDGFVCRLPRGHQGDHAYTEDPAAGRPPTDRELP